MSDNVIQEIRKHAGLFLSVAFMAAALFAVPLAGTFARYDEPLRVLVIVRDPAVAPARDVAANLVEFSGTEAYLNLFLGRIRTTYGTDVAVPRISVELPEEGSVLMLRARTDDPERSEVMAREAAHSLFLFASRYYNVKTEADFRIVGTMSADGVVDRVSAYALSASVAGLVSALLLFLAAALFRRVAESVPRVGKGAPVFDTGFFKPERPNVPIIGEEVPEEAPVSEEEPASLEDGMSGIVTAEEPEEFSGTGADEGPEAESVSEEVAEEPAIPVVTAERKSAAPMNLPGMTDAESRFLEEFSFETVEEETTDEGDDEDGMGDFHAEEAEEPAAPDMPVGPEEAPVPEQREPTREEYRRRLNELLGR